MILSGIECPIDGLPVEAEEFRLAPSAQNIASGCVIGKHLHMRIDQQIACPEGHAWRISGDLLLEREG